MCIGIFCCKLVFCMVVFKLMTMHLLGPWMTTTKYNSRKTKKTKRQKQADAAHDKWLRKMGAHPDQRKGDSSKSVAKSLSMDFTTSSTIPLSNNIVAIDNSGKLDSNTKLQHSSKYVVGQAYNKGGYQVLSAKEANDPSTGKRR